MGFLKSLKDMWEVTKKNKIAIEKFWEDNKKKYGDIKEKFNIKYMGGYLDFNIDIEWNGKLYVMDKAIVYVPLMQSQTYIGFKIPYIDIKDIKLVTEKDIHHDVTLTRMLLAGGYAFGLKKKRVDTERYIIITLEENGIDYNVAFKVGVLGQKILNDILRNMRKIERPKKEQNKTTDIPEQIEKLADLKQKGIITKEDFLKKKTELLNKM